jgi:hypothetical protein
MPLVSINQRLDERHFSQNIALFLLIMDDFKVLGNYGRGSPAKDFVRDFI